MMFANNACIMVSLLLFSNGISHRPHPWEAHSEDRWKSLRSCSTGAGKGSYLSTNNKKVKMWALNMSLMQRGTPWGKIKAREFVLEPSY